MTIRRGSDIYGDAHEEPPSVSLPWFDVVVVLAGTVVMWLLTRWP